MIIRRGLNRGTGNERRISDKRRKRVVRVGKVRGTRGRGVGMEVGEGIGD
jgi:hypothetical protein